MSEFSTTPANKAPQSGTLDEIGLDPSNILASLNTTSDGNDWKIDDFLSDSTKALQLNSNNDSNSITSSNTGVTTTGVNSTTTRDVSSSASSTPGHTSHASTITPSDSTAQSTPNSMSVTAPNQSSVQYMMSTSPDATMAMTGQPMFYQTMYVDQNGNPIYMGTDATGQAIQYVQPAGYGIPTMGGLPTQTGMMGQSGTKPTIDYSSIDQQRREREFRDLRGGGNDRGGGYGDYGGGGYGGGYRNEYRQDSYGSRYGDGYDRDRRGGRNDRYTTRRERDQSGINPGRDPLVDEFRSTFGKSRQWGVRDVLGHIVSFCQDQHGSRFIQQRLEICDDEEKQLVFDEIVPICLPLMTDVFGNYVMQKLFEYGTPPQCEQLGQLLQGQVVNLAMQMYGCRVIQKALEYVNTERLMILIREFEDPPVLLRCVHDANANHVVQKCIELVSHIAREAPNDDGDFIADHIQFIIDTFRGRVKELACHPYGCRVVQRILEHCIPRQKDVILEELRLCCADLIMDCYGNYVIQYVMKCGNEVDRAVLMKEVQTNLVDFSQHKFASNVVEKCLQYANRRDRDEMIWTIINVTFDINNPVDSKGHCVLESMVRDPYANYVVQKVIDVADERQRAAILRYVRENIAQLRRYTYGKHIIVRLEKLTQEKF